MPNPPSEKKVAEQSIDVLQKRYQDLNKKKIEAEADLRNAKKTLDDLQTEARKKYGTDDLAALQGKLKEMQEDNERKRAAYQAELDRIENNLTDVERRFTDMEASPRASGKESR